MPESELRMGLKGKKVNLVYSCLMEPHLTMECHLVAQCYLPPDTSEHTPP